jgi:hypothetical protein
MPTQRYKNRRKVCVPLKSTQMVVYGFNTNILTSEGAVLGQVDIAPGIIAIFGTNRPRPQRVRKIDPDSNATTSFADGNKTRAGLVASGWAVYDRERPLMQGRASAAARKTELVKIDIAPGISYAWSQPKEVREKLVAAGIGGALPELAGPNDRVFEAGTKFYQGGESLIKPIRIAKSTVVGSGEETELDTCTTWIDTAATVPAGWNVV